MSRDKKKKKRKEKEKQKIASRIVAIDMVSKSTKFSDDSPSGAEVKFWRKTSGIEAEKRPSLFSLL